MSVLLVESGREQFFCFRHPLVNRRTTRIKIYVTLIVLLAVLAAGLWGTSYAMLRRTPEWYQPDTSTPDQRNKAAKAFEDLLASLNNWSGRRHAATVHRKPTVNPADDPSTQQARAMLGSKPDEVFQISFTDDQLNAFFNKWANTKDRRAWFEQYVEDPRLVLRENQLILVGKVKDQGVIVSLIFEPRLDEKGRINLNLVNLLGGVLPVPDALWANQRSAIEASLARKLPMFQAGAEITPDGVANGDAGSAAMNKLISATLQYKSSDSVIFVPLNASLSQSLPVKITSVVIHDHTVQMTAEQMTEEEREGFLRELKGE
jgi:hypothetical protein